MTDAWPWLVAGVALLIAAYLKFLDYLDKRKRKP